MIESSLLSDQPSTTKPPRLDLIELCLCHNVFKRAVAQTNGPGILADIIHYSLSLSLVLKSDDYCFFSRMLESIGKLQVVMSHASHYLLTASKAFYKPSLNTQWFDLVRLG